MDLEDLWVFFHKPTYWICCCWEIEFELSWWLQRIGIHGVHFYQYHKWHIHPLSRSNNTEEKIMNVIGSLWKTLSLKTIYLHWKPQWRNSFMRKLMLKENCSLKNEINLKNWELVFNLCFLPFSFFFLGPVSSDRDSGRSPDTHWNNILLQLSIWLLFISQQREIWKYMINKLKSLKVAKSDYWNPNLKSQDC